MTEDLAEVAEDWFQGQHPLTLDDKGRVVLPREYRELLGPGAVLTTGSDDCLAIYPRGMFSRVALERVERARRGRVQRHQARHTFTKATTVKPDKQGRIQIPQVLRDPAGLTREVVVCGVFDHVEIWNAEKYRESEVVAAQPDEEEGRPL